MALRPGTIVHLLLHQGSRVELVPLIIVITCWHCCSVSSSSSWTNSPRRPTLSCAADFLVMTKRLRLKTKPSGTGDCPRRAASYRMDSAGNAFLMLSRVHLNTSWAAASPLSLRAASGSWSKMLRPLVGVPPSCSALVMLL